MDKHKPKILVTLVFFMAISKFKKWKLLSSFTNKHRSSIREKK
jgi:hypothetical protein